MRASAVRAAIFDAHTEATLDTKAGAGDGFVALKTPQEPASVSGRTVQVQLVAGPDKANENSDDTYWVTYRVSRFYEPSDDIEDRIASDNERLELPLSDASMIAREADIQTLTRGATSVAEGLAMIVARQDLAVLFRLDSALL